MSYETRLVYKLSLIDRIKLGIKLKRAVRVKYKDLDTRILLGEDLLTRRGDITSIKFKNLSLLEIKYIFKLLFDLKLKNLKSAKSRLDATDSEIEYETKEYTYVLKKNGDWYRLIVRDCRYGNEL